MMALLNTDMLFIVFSKTLLAHTFTELFRLCFTLKTKPSLANLTIIYIKFINVEGWFPTLRTKTKTTKDITTMINTNYLRTHGAFELFRLLSRIIVI